jgi:hypothetical protein
MESALLKLHLRLPGFTVSAPWSYYSTCCTQEQSNLPLRVHLSDYILSKRNCFRIHALRHFELLPDDLFTETTIIAAESVFSGPHNI